MELNRAKRYRMKASGLVVAALLLPGAAFNSVSIAQTATQTAPAVQAPSDLFARPLAQAQTAGQAQTGAQPAAQPATGLHRILLDVRVTDKQGQAIRGLKREDFTLLDNKQTAAIVDFHEVMSHFEACEIL